jgi:DNA-binding transcriptional LysR family regulator
MDLKRVRTFVAVVEQGSMSKAALHLHLSQPALSRQISDLQEELGFRLFEHVGRRLILSSEGEQLLGNCRDLLAYASSLSERAKLLRRGDTALLTVAASALQIEAFLSTFLHRYAQHYPNVQVKLIEAAVSDILPMLERSEIQLGILLQVVLADYRQFGSYSVPPIELLAVCHPTFPLLECGDRIDINHLGSHSLLLLDYSSLLRPTFDAVCRLARFKPNILIESSMPSNLLTLAEAGHGIAVVQSIVPTHRYTLRVASLTYERKPIGEPLAVVWDKRRVLPRYTQDFCKLLAAHMRELFPLGQASAPMSGVAQKSRNRTRHKVAAHIK